MPLTWFFPAIALVYGMGNWFTFLALIIHVQLEAGAAASAGLFLVQSLPALLLAGQLARAVPPHRVRRAWVACQLVLAALTVVAALAVDRLWTVYVYAGVTMIVRAVANPLLMTLVSDHVGADDRPRVLRSVSAVSAISLAVAPAIGGALLPVTGPAALLLINAAAFLVVAAAMLMHPGTRPAGAIAAQQAVPLPREARGWVRVPGVASLTRVEGTATRVWADPYTRLWMLLLVGGAVLNVIETPLVFDVLAFDETAFGWMLTGYGTGGLIVLLTSSRRERMGATRLGMVGIGVAILAAFGALALTSLVPAPAARVVVAVAAFALLGFGGSWLSGTIRGWLDASTRERDPGEIKATWTWASQVTLAINLIVYLTFFAIYQVGSAGAWVFAPVVLAYAAVVVALTRARPIG